MALVALLSHIIFLGVYVYVSTTLVTYAEKNSKSSDPNIKTLGELTFRFLTNWTYGMQLIYYLCIVFADILTIVPALQKISNKLRGFTDVLFTTIVVPFGLVVTTFFWVLFTLDRELVYPAWVDKVIPSWMNHAIHTFNTIIPLIDMVLTNHKFPSWSLTALCIILYQAAYGVCFFGTYFTEGRWVYPMFAKMTLPETAGFMVGVLFSAFLFHSIARLISKLIWGTSSTEKPKSKKSKQKSKKVA